MIREDEGKQSENIPPASESKDEITVEVYINICMLGYNIYIYRIKN